jgi:hypothetical protein
VLKVIGLAAFSDGALCLVLQGSRACVQAEFKAEVKSVIDPQVFGRAAPGIVPGQGNT